jgi:anti-sigma B factor antagonist
VPNDFAFDVSDVAGDHVVSLHGQLDLVDADRVRDALIGIAGSTVVVDLADLQFLDSSGIAGLLQARKQIIEGGNGFQMRNAHGIVLRVLEVTGLTHLLAEETTA